MLQSLERGSAITQGVVLTLAPILAVMGFVLVAPILASMQAHFQNVPHSDIWVPLVMTAPALCIALFSPLAGVLADRFGARRVLLISLSIYAVFGTAPLYLESLYAIVVTRFGVGIAEAGILTCTMTLVGVLFQGDERQRWLAYQSGTAPAAAALLLLAGGIIGSGGWRFPFWGYALSVLVFVGVLLKVVEPEPRKRDVINGPPIPWPHLLKVCVFALFASLIFYLVPAELAFVLFGRGIQSPSVIGLTIAIGTLAVPLGTLTSRRLTGLPVGRVLSAAMVIMGIGLIVIALGATLPVITAGVIIHQFGGGIMLPTAMNYALSRLPAESQGRGTGVWWSAYFIAQFITPLSVTAVATGLGTLAAALLAFAVACFVFCLPVLAVTRAD
ncbi:MAG TPA: MFS transporter [Steroidobacteraceae bacterium]